MNKLDISFNTIYDKLHPEGEHVLYDYINMYGNDGTFSIAVANYNFTLNIPFFDNFNSYDLLEIE